MSDVSEILFSILSNYTYPKKPFSFAYETLEPIDKKRLNAGQSIDFDFKGYQSDANGNVTLSSGSDNIYRLYLQPDVAKGFEILPGPGKGTHIQKEIPLMTDAAAGFNSYFLTDTPNLSSKTKNAYLAIRGTDGQPKSDMSNWNDWLNNLQFFFGDGLTGQGKLAGEALKGRLKEMKENGSSQTKLHVTGHSLGSIAAVQGLASLSMKELDQIGEVRLFNGPNPVKSLVKMGVSSEKIQKIKEHTIYYLNPFDLVSALNWEEPPEEWAGDARILVPKHYTGTFDSNSSHNLSEIQLGPNGEPLVASEEYHPELLNAHKELAFLIFNYKSHLHFNDEKMKDPAKLFADFQAEYQAIIDQAKKESLAWSRQHLAEFQEKVKAAKGEELILLRTELLYMISQTMRATAEEKNQEAKNLLKDSKERVEQIVRQMQDRVHAIAQHLSLAELDHLMAPYSLHYLWQNATEEANLQEVEAYTDGLLGLANGLTKAVADFRSSDTDGARSFKDLMAN